MFRRDLFRQMDQVLCSFDASVVKAASFRFAGGTCLAMRLDEYRLSRDLGFVCSDGQGYAHVRYEVRQRGYQALFRSAADLTFPREIRVDQYGIRFPVVVEGRSIRVELIREARITLGDAEVVSWSALPVLSVRDAFAEKLLANSDRWADRDDLSRDLIDLAMLRVTHGAIPNDAWLSAERAYGAAPAEDLRKAAERFLNDGAYQQRCFVGLDVDRGEDVLRGVQLLLADPVGPG